MLSDELDELEHQALDRLDELDDPQEDDAEALERIEAAFDRLAIGEARRLLDAAEALAEAGRGVSKTAIIEVRAAIDENPELAPALTPTLELIGLGLGLTRDRVGWTKLIERGERAAARAPEGFAELSTELAAVLREAWPRPEAPSPSVALRAFRLQVLGGAGPSLRTHALAVEYPEHAKLAAALLASRPDGSARELVEAFDAARVQVQPTNDEATTMPGPKRRFTWVHALLAAIILGLTLWHYLAR